ncbi:MAG: recombinase family protein, partial [Patescibacteria group bacterium]
MKISLKPDGEKMKAVMYARVSSREQEQGYSLAAQVKLIKDYAQRSGIEVVKEFVCSESAKGDGRKVFSEMIECLKSNLTIEAVLCEKVDRLLRGNLKDRVEIDDLINKFGKKVIFVKDGTSLSVDSKSTEKLTYGIQAELARFYLNNLSDEVKKGLTEKASRGEYPGSPPFGYVRKEGKVLVHSQTSIATKKAFEWFATGSFSIRQLRNRLVEEGLAKKLNSGILGSSDIGHMLRNPFYYGEFRWTGKLYPSKGDYESLISRDLWDKVQEVLNNQNKPRTRKHNFNFTMLLKCGECGYSVTAEKKTKFYPKTNRKAEYTYYHCTRPKSSGIKCHQKPITEGEMVDQLTEVVDRVSITDEVVEILKDILRRSTVEEHQYHLDAVTALNGQYKGLQEKKKRLLDGYLEGAVKAGTYQVKDDDLEGEIRDVEAKLQKHKEGNRAYYEQIENFVELCYTAPQLFRRSSTRLKRELLRYVVSDLYLIDRKVRCTYKFPFSELLKTKENG